MANYTMYAGYEYSGAFTGPGQVDTYTSYLLAGVAYSLRFDATTTDFWVSMAGPNGTVYPSHPTSSLWTYTPSLTGYYAFALDTTYGQPGSYSFSAGFATLNMVDTTTGQSSQPFLFTYTGPVAGLIGQYVTTTSDNINLTATSNNVFLHSGSGEDALAAFGGTNVLDGGTGSNFLVGVAGGSNDTFFVDDRGPPADVWSTIVNFHAGDSATIWGVTQAGFDLSWLDNQGAAGYAGLTGTFSAPGQPEAIFTLSGYTSADLSDGRLSISYGRTQDLPGLPGSNYMLIQAH